MPNSKIPKEALESFYDYCKENPQAKVAVDAVIKAFSLSPHSIGEFVENCKDFPLPTNQASFDNFCENYNQEVKTKVHAPKVDFTNQQETQGNKKIAEATQGIAEKQQEIPKEKAEISEKRQEILTILSS